jgi:uncharacterized protein (TIGR00251 family)
LTSSLGIRPSKEGLRFEVLVKVRASRTAVLGVEAARLGVALAAPPVDGAANEALRRLLAEHFELPRQSVAIVGGEKSRRKLVELRGIAEADVRARLGEVR